LITFNVSVGTFVLSLKPSSRLPLQQAINGIISKFEFRGRSFNDFRPVRKTLVSALFIYISFSFLNSTISGEIKFILRTSLVSAIYLGNDVLHMYPCSFTFTI
jgi:hypothetical protein